MNVRITSACVFVLAFSAVACSRSPTAPSPNAPSGPTGSPSSTFVSFTSSPEYNAGGVSSGRFTPADGRWRTSFWDNAQGQFLSVVMVGGPSTFSFLLQSARGGRLGVGAYEIAGSSSDGSQPSMSFNTQGTGCNVMHRRFVIHALTLGSPNYNGEMAIKRLHATFEVYCQFTTPSLRGEISIVRDDPPLPSPASSPSTTFLSFTSSPFDYIGQGQTEYWGLNDGTWEALIDPNFGKPYLKISVKAPDLRRWWELHLAPRSGELLGVGVYNDAQGWPFQLPSYPALTFFGTARGCTSAGRFVIHKLAIAGDNTIERLHAHFDHHCDTNIQGLRGEVSIVANPWR